MGIRCGQSHDQGFLRFSECEVESIATDAHCVVSPEINPLPGNELAFVEVRVARNNENSV